MVQSASSFDPASRLAAVGDGAGNTAAYSYLANSPLVGQIIFKQGTATRMTTSKQYDLLNRLSSITNTPSAVGSSAIGCAYANNSANQRTAVTNADGSYWLYGYDSLGQVISGKRYWSDNTPVAGQQFQYGFDDIGNRTNTASGGDVAGANLRSQTYRANALNQYTERTVPAYLNVIGTANSTSTVSLWGTTGSYAPTSRKGEYFRGELPADNNANPLWIGITNLAALTNGTTDIVTNLIGSEFVPQTPEAFTYDLDGNLTSDGRWNYTWDAENRLVKLAARVSAGPQISLQFEYDARGRRIRKQVWGNPAWSGGPTNDLKFVYDGWNLLGELSGASAVRTYLWGLDLSGSLHGAGGVGGLLEMNSGGTVTFAGFDGNGNVAGLANAADGTQVAQYEYGPFGQVIRATGPARATNPFRFSTKYQDDETDLLYYGYRYYSASTGRWLSRDPSGEAACPSLIAFVENNPVGAIDKNGLVTIEYDSTWLPLKGSCGGFDLQFNELLDNVHSEDGYLVQEVTVTEVYYSCLLMVKHIRIINFWEQMGTNQANVVFPGSVDKNSSIGKYRLFSNTEGEARYYFQTRWYPKSLTGELRKIWGPYTPPGFAEPISKHATPTKPPWWDESAQPPINGEYTGWHAILTAWNCCCQPYTDTLFFQPH